MVTGLNYRREGSADAWSDLSEPMSSLDTSIRSGTGSAPFPASDHQSCGLDGDCCCDLPNPTTQQPRHPHVKSIKMSPIRPVQPVTALSACTPVASAMGW